MDSTVISSFAHVALSMHHAVDRDWNFDRNNVCEFETSGDWDQWGEFRKSSREAGTQIPT